MTTSTVIKTYRIPAALHKLIAIEAEKDGRSEADFVRDALKTYFEQRTAEARIDVLEKRLMNKIEFTSQHIATLVQQVIAMAGPAE